MDSEWDKDFLGIRGRWVGIGGLKWWILKGDSAQQMKDSENQTEKGQSSDAAMSLFKITGVDRSGVKKSIALEAANERQAIELAKQQGIHPTQMTKVKRQVKQHPAEKKAHDEQFDAAIQASLLEKLASADDDKKKAPVTAPHEIAKAVNAVTVVGIIQYDPVVIQQYARGMYKRARRIIFEYTIAGGFFFAVCGCLIIGMLLGRGGDLSTGVFLLAGVISFSIGAYIGYQKGVSQAFWCKFAAQRELCQAQIEVNIRNKGHAKC